MKRYFIVADCHSFYTLMREALNEAGFDINNPEHIFVSLGDLFDRGNESREMLDFVLSLPQERKILIMGNHERLMFEMVHRHWAGIYDHHNGTTKTACDLTGEKDENIAIQMMWTNSAWWEYYWNCEMYAEIGNCIFVHGWIPYQTNFVQKYDDDGMLQGMYVKFDKDYDWRNAPKSEWFDATWYNGMKEWNSYGGVEGKTIFCGHWHTSYGHAILHNDGVEFIDDYIRDHPDEDCDGIYENFEPFIDKGIVAMDGCTAYSGIVNCIALNEDELNRYPLF